MTINGDYQRLVADREELLRSLLLRVLSKRALKTVKMRGRIAPCPVRALVHGEQ